MDTDSGSNIVEYVELKISKEGVNGEDNAKVFETFLLESMRYEERIEQKDVEKIVSGEICWNNCDIYEIENSLNSFESYWTEMSYYLYENS